MSNCREARRGEELNKLKGAAQLTHDQLARLYELMCWEDWKRREEEYAL